MKQSLRVIQQPDAEPVTLEQAKAHCRVEIADDDDLIQALVKAARRWAENYCNRYFVTQTVELTLDCLPSWWLELPGGTVQSVESVKYYDAYGELQTWDSAEYLTDLDGEPARLEPADGYTWPATQRRIGAVKARYVVGYEPGEGSPTDYAANVPQEIKQAILMLVGHWYEHRESAAEGAPLEVPFGVESLLWPCRILEG